MSGFGRSSPGPAWIAAFIMVTAPAFAPSSVAAMTAVRATVRATQRAATDVELDRLDSLVARNRLAEARSALDRWNNAHPSTDSNVTVNDRAHSFILRARLAQNWERAQEAYVAIALGYPISAHAPEALLRLAQGLVTVAGTGQPNASRRAIAYLERLIADYPTTPFRADGFLWLARALELDGQRGAACNRLAEARTIQADSATSSLIRIESRRLCPDHGP